jgi:hypothetical protein
MSDVFQRALTDDMLQYLQVKIGYDPNVVNDLSTSLAQNTSHIGNITGNIISPESYTGNAVQKLQSAIADAVTTNAIVKINRMYDITGLGSIVINKAADLGNRRVLYLISDGGGIIKNDAGYVFDAPAQNVGDIIIKGFRFVSTAGAGAIVWNCNNFIRIHSAFNEYYNWDTIAEANNYIFQSLRFTNEHIVGGNGWAFTTKQVYDSTIEHCLFENRQNGIKNTQDASGVMNYNLRILNNVMENFSGIPIQLMGCWTSEISNNYFEANQGGCIDLQTLAVNSTHIALQVRGNNCTLTSTQLTNGNSAILVGNTSELTNGYTNEGTDTLKDILSNCFIGNASNGKLFSKTGTGNILSIGNYTPSTNNLGNSEYLLTGLNRHSDGINRFSGLTRGLKFTQTVTIPASTTQLSTLTLYSGTNYAPCKDEDMVQVYVQEVGQVNVLGIYPTFGSANNGSLKVNLQNTTASSITAHLTIVVFKVWE